MAKTKKSKKQKVVYPKVKVGQIWIDNDKRHEGRRGVHVTKVDMKAKPEPVVHVLAYSPGVPPKKLKIKLRRFKPTSSGYRLEGAAPATTRTAPYRWDEVKEAREQGREPEKYTDRPPKTVLQPGESFKPDGVGYTIENAPTSETPVVVEVSTEPQPA